MHQIIRSIKSGHPKTYCSATIKLFKSRKRVTQKSVNWLIVNCSLTGFHMMGTSVENLNNFERLHKEINRFESSATFHKETSHLIYKANQMTGSCMKCNTGLEWDKDLSTGKYSPNLSELISEIIRKS